MAEITFTTTVVGDLPNTEQASANMSLFMDTVIAFAGVNFRSFQRFAIDLAQTEPASPEIAAWFANMDPGFIAWLMGANR